MLGVTDFPLTKNTELINLQGFVWDIGNIIFNYIKDGIIKVCPEVKLLIRFFSRFPDSQKVLKKKFAFAPICKATLIGVLIYKLVYIYVVLWK